MQIVTYLYLFFQTISIALWVSSYCDSVLRPFKSNLQKKKKKKKESSVAMVDNVPFFSSPTPNLTAYLYWKKNQDRWHVNKLVFVSFEADVC